MKGFIRTVLLGLLVAALFGCGGAGATTSLSQSAGAQETQTGTVVGTIR